jgi:ribA/ribD-fused uncharacterized protein
MFRGEFSFLSNFHPVEIKYGNLVFKSVESAFQALKSEDFEVRKMFVDLGPAEAKALGRKIKLRGDWNKIKDNVMEYLLRIKFKNIELRRALLATGEQELVEGNYWNDRYWGVDLRSNIGENKLGKLLMRIRKEIRDGLQ